MIYTVWDPDVQGHDEGKQIEAEDPEDAVTQWVENLLNGDTFNEGLIVARSPDGTEHEVHVYVNMEPVIHTTLVTPASHDTDD